MTTLIDLSGRIEGFLVVRGRGTNKADDETTTDVLPEPTRSGGKPVRGKVSSFKFRVSNPAAVIPTGAVPHPSFLC